MAVDFRGVRASFFCLSLFFFVSIAGIRVLGSMASGLKLLGGQGLGV